NEMYITMKQSSPRFVAFKGSREHLAHSIGLQESDIHHDLPILYGSTGTWTLLIPIKDLTAFKKMKPNNKSFPKILKEMPKTSIHPFCLDSYNPEADMHARHFSSPFSGTVEDAVTGTASGVMGAYYAKYIHTNLKESLNLIIEQGHEIEKDGQVMVHVSKNKETFDVSITGNAVLVKEMEVL